MSLLRVLLQACGAVPAAAAPGARRGAACLALAGALALVHLAAPAAEAGNAGDARLQALLQRLPAAEYDEKQQIIGQLAQTADRRVRPVLAALLEGNLLARSAGGQVCIASADGSKCRDPVSGIESDTASLGDTAAVGVNNQLRKALRVALAQFDLADPDVAVRRTAVKEMLRAPDAGVLAILRARAPLEGDARVRALIGAGLALADLDSADSAQRLAAIALLKGNLNPEVYNRLSVLASGSGDGQAADADPRVRAAAAAALRSIQSARLFYSNLQTLLFGLSQGSILVLAAIGLAITFGVMGVINMAHGELMMLGAYATYLTQQAMPDHIGASIVVAIPVAFLVAGLVGIAIERGIVRFLYGRPLETLLATFGVSLLLQQAVRDLFSANNRSVITPEWLAGSLEINDALSITYNHLYIVVFTFAVFALLQLVLRRTRLGLEMRAVSQNRAMARAMGIRTGLIDALTFGLGSGIAGVAGVALSQLTNVGPNLGQSYIVDSFMVVVLGGVGQLAGTVIAALGLGSVAKFLEPFSGPVLAKIAVLVAIIIFIQKRPQGLFALKGRAAD